MKAPTGMSATLLLALLGGCSGDAEPAPADPAALPVNLCAAVPQDVVERWQLAETTHETRADSSRAVATCAMAGRYEGGSVTVQLRLESYGGSDGSEARETMMAELADQCAQLEQSAQGRFVGDENDCTDRAGRGLSARVVQVARAIPVSGTARIEMAHDGQGASLVGAEVERLTGVLTTTDPDELG